MLLGTAKENITLYFIIFYLQFLLAVAEEKKRCARITLARRGTSEGLLLVLLVVVK